MSAVCVLITYVVIKEPKDRTNLNLCQQQFAIGNRIAFFNIHSDGGDGGIQTKVDDNPMKCHCDKN